MRSLTGPAQKSYPSKIVLLAILACGIVIGPIAASAVPGDGHWDRQFGLPGVTNRVYALRFNGSSLYASGYPLASGGPLGTNTAVDIFDGTNWSSSIGEFSSSGTFIIEDLAFIGSDVYVGGFFEKAGGISANSLARWDGNQWHSVGGFAGIVFALATDGTNLYVGGSFTNVGGVLNTNIAKWNGTNWSSLGQGLGYFDPFLATGVNVLDFHNGELYAGGIFTNAGSLSVSNLAKWNGATWSPVGGNVNGNVTTMQFQGDDLYIGGNFTSVGGITASNVAKWNGANWSALGSGAKAAPNSVPVTCLGVIGTDVYIGGNFTNAGGVPALRIAKWNGSAWSALGTGLNSTPNRMRVYGNSLYIGGVFNQGDSVIGNNVIRYDGANFWGLGSKPANGVVNVGFVECIATGNDGVYLGGFFTTAGKTKASRIARWDGTNWFALGSGTMGFGANGNVVRAIAPRGIEVFVAGQFTNAGGVTVSNVARWDGANWWPMGMGVDNAVFAMTATPTDVYLGGQFTVAYDFVPVSASRIARWDGANWSSLGSGLSGTVRAIAVSGGLVYAGGEFTSAGGNTANRIAVWDGLNWSSLGLGTANGVNNTVWGLLVNGSDVYVAGQFTTAGGLPAGGIAKWNGVSWSALASSLTGRSSRVQSLVWLGGKMYAGGSFTNINGLDASSIARWDGTKWETLGSGLFASTSARGGALTLWGNDLYVGGIFDGAGASEAGNVCRWNEQIDFTPPTKMRFSNTQALPGSLFKSRLTVTERATYVVEYSDNFQTWTPLLTNGLSQLDFTNSAVAGGKARVYRSREIP
jgi:hypothetical protein